MKNKFLKMGLGATVASVLAAGVFVSTAPVLAQSTAPGATAAPSVQQGKGGRSGGPRGGHMGARGMHIAEVAKALGMTDAELKTELEAGKSVADIASAKGVSIDTIVAAIITAQTDRLKQAVTDGKLTQAQADTLLANLKLTLPSQLQTKWVGAPLNGGPGKHGDKGHGLGAGIREGAQTVAKTLGMTTDELRTELQAGKSVSDVAAAKNVSINTVIDAVIVEQTTLLKQAVTDGKLTQAAADQRLATLKANLPKLFELKGGMGGPSGRGPGNRPNGTAPSTSDQSGPTS